MLNQCEWSDEKNVQCSNTAAWRHHSTDKHQRQKIWKLCDGHKRMLLNSYNETWRAKETSEWWSL